MPLAVFLVLLAVCGARVRTDDPVSSNVRYTGAIVRIFDRKCLPCHHADGLAMALSNYRDVRAWGRAIREEIVEQRMPPWAAARGYGSFANALALTAREETTILSWLDGGMPRGDDRDLPRAPASTQAAADPPNLHLVLPAQLVPPLDEHVVRRVVVETGLDVARTVERLVVNPGHRTVLRGVLVFAGDPQSGGRWIGAWLPWQQHVAWPAGHAIRLPAHARLTVELHYRGGEKEINDQPTIDLSFVKVALTPAKVRLKPDTTEAGGHDDLIVRAGAPTRLATSTTLWAVLPEGNGSVKSLELSARRPNGSVDVLLWIPEFRREWPQALVLQNPMTVPAGTTLSLAAQPPTATARVRLSLVKSAR